MATGRMHVSLNFIVLGRLWDFSPCLFLFWGGRLRSIDSGECGLDPILPFPVRIRIRADARELDGIRHGKDPGDIRSFGEALRDILGGDRLGVTIPLLRELMLQGPVEHRRRSCSRPGFGARSRALSDGCRSPCASHDSYRDRIVMATAEDGDALQPRSALPPESLVERGTKTGCRAGLDR